jgi:hypothetical protein
MVADGGAWESGRRVSISDGPSIARLHDRYGMSETVRKNNVMNIHGGVMNDEMYEQQRSE